jgi:hypothetical protein
MKTLAAVVVIAIAAFAVWCWQDQLAYERNVAAAKEQQSQVVLGIMDHLATQKACVDFKYAMTKQGHGLSYQKNHLAELGYNLDCTAKH